jgi:hypothetical protein
MFTEPVRVCVVVLVNVVEPALNISTEGLVVSSLRPIDRLGIMVYVHYTGNIDV